MLISSSGEKKLVFLLENGKRKIIRGNISRIRARREQSIASEEKKNIIRHYLGGEKSLPVHLSRVHRSSFSVVVINQTSIGSNDIRRERKAKFPVILRDNRECPGESRGRTRSIINHKVHPGPFDDPTLVPPSTIWLVTH